MIRRWACGIVVAVALVGCGSGSDDAATTVDSAESNDASSDQADGEAPAATTGPAAGDGESTSEDPADSPDATEDDPPGEVEPEAEGFRLLTTGAGLGIRPLLEWTAAEGAARYDVSIRLPGVGQYWAWSGDTTSVPFGSDVGLELDAAGPALTVEMSFSVAAVDADGVPIAFSEATIAP